MSVGKFQGSVLNATLFHESLQRDPNDKIKM